MVKRTAGCEALTGSAAYVILLTALCMCELEAPALRRSCSSLAWSACITAGLLRPTCGRQPTQYSTCQHAWHPCGLQRLFWLGSPSCCCGIQATAGAASCARSRNNHAASAVATACEQLCLLLLRHGLACSRGGLLLHLYLSILKVAFLQSLNTYLMECVLFLSDGHTSWQAMGALPDVYSRIFGRLDQTVTIHWIGHAVRRAASQLGASRASSGAAASASIAGAEHTGQRTRGIWRLPKLGGGWGIRATDIRLPPLLPGVPFRDAYQVCHI